MTAIGTLLCPELKNRRDAIVVVTKNFLDSRPDPSL